jgi:hypothetical protein
MGVLFAPLFEPVFPFSVEPPHPASAHIIQRQNQIIPLFNLIDNTPFSYEHRLKGETLAEYDWFHKTAFNQGASL